MKARIKEALLRIHDPRKSYLKRQKEQGTFCFIHINKCGGSSIEKALGLPKIHDSARQRRIAVGEDRWNAMFTFSVVRHPFAKAASHYRYRVRTNQSGLADRHMGLNEWIRRAYGDKDPAYYDQPLMFAPCLEWVTDDGGAIIVDYIAKLEEIDAAWPYIQERCGVSVDLPRSNETAPSNDSLDRLDDTSREILANHFAPDFRQFGYSIG